MVVIEENVEFKTDFDKAKIAEDVVGEILKKAVPSNARWIYLSPIPKR